MNSLVLDPPLLFILSVTIFSYPTLFHHHEELLLARARPVLMIFMFLVNRPHWKIGMLQKPLLYYLYSYSAEQLQLVFYGKKMDIDNNGIMDNNYRPCACMVVRKNPDQKHNVINTGLIIIIHIAVDHYPLCKQ